MTDALSWAGERLGPAPERGWHGIARPQQLPPPGDWSIWVILAGRGFGKSRAGSEWILESALHHPQTDWAIVAPTFGAARDICIEGPSGILRIAGKREVAHYVRSLGEIRLSNGSRLYARSADEPDRLRGLNLSGAWCDELALFRYDSIWYEALIPAVRHDPARIMVTTTPRATPLLTGPGGPSGRLCGPHKGQHVRQCGEPLSDGSGRTESPLRGHEDWEGRARWRTSRRCGRRPVESRPIR